MPSRIFLLRKLDQSVAIKAEKCYNDMNEYFGVYKAVSKTNSKTGGIDHSNFYGAVRVHELECCGPNSDMEMGKSDNGRHADKHSF